MSIFDDDHRLKKVDESIEINLNHKIKPNKNRKPQRLSPQKVVQREL